MEKYTAKIFLGEIELLEGGGNDLDELYDWMLLEAQGRLGDLHGEIIDNQTQKVVKQFRKSPPD